MLNNNKSLSSNIFLTVTFICGCFSFYKTTIIGSLYFGEILILLLGVMILSLNESIITSDSLKYLTYIWFAAVVVLVFSGLKNHSLLPDITRGFGRMVLFFFVFTP